jgi:hypothetical protein
MSCAEFIGFSSAAVIDKLGGTRISDRTRQGSFIVAAGASPYATCACIHTWLTDLRADLPQIDCGGPKTLSTSCDLGVFMDDAAKAIASPNLELI